MPSQTDLDQGGTSREWARVYRGHGVGWILVPWRNVLSITAAGTYNLDLSTSLVEVNVAGAVTIVLPSAIEPAVGPQAVPGPFGKNPVTITDIGGNATAHPITINPISGSENIAGLATLSLAVNYARYVLGPSSAQRGWTFV